MPLPISPEQQEELELAIYEAKMERKPRRLIESLFYIRGENEQVIPFTYNDIQSHYDENRSRRNIKAKPRKIGFTTQEMAEAFALSVTIPNFEVLALTYDEEEAEYAFRMIRTFYENLPEWFRPKLAADSAREMEFLFTKPPAPKVSSFIQVQTAGGRRKGRGRTPSKVILDEFALYKETEQEEVYTAVVNSAPSEAEISIQSTPNGIGNRFHGEFTRGLQGEGIWKPHFYPWMWLPERHRLNPDDPTAFPEDRGEFALTDEEMTLISTWNDEHPDKPINIDNIRWRRMKMRLDPDRMKQEFPEDSVSMFLSTTETVFPTEELNPLVARAIEPKDTRLSGRWKIWRRPEAGVRYCIGVDCGAGIVGRDNSVAVIGTSDGRVDAVIAGIWGETEFASIVTSAAEEYNNAFIINERQAGFTFQTTVLNSLGYRNIYRHKDNAGFSKPDYEYPLGYPTTGSGASSNKMRLIDGMRTALRSDGFYCLDIETLRELVEYKVHKDGSYGAPVGRHDDRAMASMLYLYGIRFAGHGSATRSVARAAPARTVKYPAGVF